MKLNYRDKVILGIILAIAIVVAGYLALIKPKNEIIKSDSKKLDSLEVTEQDYKQKIDQIEPLKETINNTVADTKKITDNFVPMDKIKNTVLLDRYMQHYANDYKLKLTSLALGDLTDSTVGYYYIPASAEIGSGLRSLADINGDYLKAYEATRVEDNQLSARAAGQVLTAQYGITATGKKEDLWKFLDAMENEKQTIIIDSVSFSKIEKEEDKKDAENKEETTKSDEEKANNETIKPEDEVSINMIITLYSVYDLPQVKVDDIQ